MSSLYRARGSLLQRLELLLKLLRELRTPAGRRRVGGRLRRSASPAFAVHAGPREGRGEGASHPATAWQPRELAERLARRARRAASAERRTGANVGGVAVRDRYGPEFYSSIGARGGSTVLEERGVEYLHDLGARGGAATRQRYGPEHYAEIGRKGGLAGRGRKRPRKRP
jgi:uncharacterized protein